MAIAEQLHQVLTRNPLEDRDVRDAQAEEHGRRLLGMVQTDRRMEGRGFVWELRGRAQTEGLPGGLVTDARAALQTEQNAWRALATAEAQARAYAEAHGLSGATSFTHMELTTAEARTAARTAADRCEAAMQQLGRAALQIAQARQVLAAIPERRAALEREHARALAELAGAETNAKRLLAIYEV
jgi:uncharacterized membrane protein YccC